MQLLKVCMWAFSSDLNQITHWNPDSQTRQSTHTIHAYLTIGLEVSANILYILHFSVLIPHPQMFKYLGLARTIIYSVYTEFLAGESPNIQCIVYIQGSGQPYMLCVWCVFALTSWVEVSTLMHGLHASCAHRSSWKQRSSSKSPFLSAMWHPSSRCPATCLMHPFRCVHFMRWS